MNLILRQSTFETNSSSCHALTFVNKNMNEKDLMDAIESLTKGRNYIVIDFNHGYDGWYFGEHYETQFELPIEKVSYLFSNILHVENHIDKLNNFCKWLSDFCKVESIYLGSINSHIDLSSLCLIFNENKNIKLESFSYLEGFTTNNPNTFEISHYNLDVLLLDKDSDYIADMVPYSLTNIDETELWKNFIFNKSTLEISYDS